MDEPEAKNGRANMTEDDDSDHSEHARRKQLDQLRAAVIEDETRSAHLKLVSVWIGQFAATLSGHQDKQTARALALVYGQRYERYAAEQSDRHAQLEGQALSSLWYLVADRLGE
jgi:hypothetical protein